MSKNQMFDQNYSSFKYIISNIAIIGYSEEDIIKRGNNINETLKLTCLYSYPEFDNTAYNDITYDMMFPDGNHEIDSPKYFSLFLTNEKGNHSFLYCLKFSEIFSLDINENNIINSIEIDVPIVICIKSEKRDLESFRQLLTSINQIIVNENIDHGANKVNNYKKVELMNLFYFIFSLPYMPPHSLVRLKLNNTLCELQEEINFYFSSNCEIPCNTNDTDINLLFSIFDQTIIIKVIIAILTEKHIIFVASQAYLLHMVIPAFLQLIFPFKWHNSCITILTKDNLDLLDVPTPFIVGILSSSIQIQELFKRYSVLNNLIVIDCDTNEIYGENVPFIPLIDKEKEEKYKKLNNQCIEEGFIQGHNHFFIRESYLFQNELDSKGRLKLLNFNEKNDIIINTEKSQMFINNFSDFISSQELKWLRKNIQLVKNPEIFDIENINKKKNRDIIKNIIYDESESPILLNRPFSYNVQNILIKFYLKKISETKSEFMNLFKRTNLYLNYIDTKQFQNNTGKVIIQNIKETMNDQRSIYNSFIVEYNYKPFNALSIIDKLITKLNEINNSVDKNKNIKINEKEINKKKNRYKYLKNVLMDYCSVIGINNSQDKNEIFNIEYDEKNKLQHLRIKSISQQSNNLGSMSILEMTCNRNPSFSFPVIDKSSKNSFKFYGKDGLLFFLTNIESFIKDEGKNLDSIIYKKKIYNQLINIYKNLFFEKNKNNEIINTNINVLDNNQVENKKSNLNEINIEKEINTEEIESEKSNKNYHKKLTYQKINKGLENNDKIIRNLSVEKDENAINEKLDEIITFLDIDKKKEKDNNDLIKNMFISKNVKKKNNKKIVSQYYLLLAFYLEEINSNYVFLNLFNKDIYNASGRSYNINELILRLYKDAYFYSGPDHRDFPYFSFYSFLVNLDKKQFSKLYIYINKNKYIDLYDIYMNIVNTKKYYIEDYNKSISKIIIINNLDSFKLHNTSKSNNIQYEMIYDLFQLLINCFPTKADIQTKSTNEILEQVNEKVNILPIFDLVAELKLIKLSSISSNEKRLCFWLNCFNCLSLMAIFHLKLNISDREIWKNFLHNVKYNIGGFDFSLEDMIYIIFQKNVFFPDKDYIPPEHVKKNIIDPLDIISSNELPTISPLLLYLPIKEFFRPNIYLYNKNDFESYLSKGIINYFYNFLTYDKDTESLYINELLLILEPDFIVKGGVKKI